MSRYVDIEGDWVDEAIKTYSLGYYDDDEYAIPFEALDSAPSIEIIRCRECKYYNGKYCFNSSVTLPTEPKPDDFCSYGERKTND